ncbi:MAG TPA: hypothetical protein VIV06_12415 [Candidatus Limnocylindrales bacterium]
MLTETGTASNLASDVHLAAMALERVGEIVTFVRDLARFPGVRVQLLGAG